MTGEEILDVLNAIAATSSSNEKISLLKKNNNSDLRNILSWALNPYITFGIADLKFVDKHYTQGKGSSSFRNGSISLLNYLSSRKLTGNDARSAIGKHLETLAPKDAELFRRILLKDLRCGISGKIVNKAIPDLIPEFSVMLAQPFEGQALAHEKVLVEEKLDGIRCIIIIDCNNPKAFTRSGREITTIDHILEQIRRLGLNNCVLDGEIIADTFNQTVSEVRRKDYQAENTDYAIFDFISDLREFVSGNLKENLITRKRNLYQLSIQSLVLDGELPNLRFIGGKICRSMDEVKSYRDEIWQRGGEGVIIKDLNAVYEKKRSKAWLKIKAKETYDCEIKDVIEGTGKYANMMGAIVVGFNEGSVNVGTGFSDDDRDIIWREHKLGKVIGRIIEVECHELTPDGSMRHPRFIKWRDTSQAPGVKV